MQTRDVLGIPCKSPEIRREIFDCKSLNFRSTFSRSRTVNRYSSIMDHVVAFKYHVADTLFNKIDSRDDMIGVPKIIQTRKKFKKYKRVCVYIYI